MKFLLIYIATVILTGSAFVLRIKTRGLPEPKREKESQPVTTSVTIGGQKKIAIILGCLRTEAISQGLGGNAVAALAEASFSLSHRYYDKTQIIAILDKVKASVTGAEDYFQEMIAECYDEIDN